MPLFEAMGKNIKYEGKAGNGQHTKMCNQIAIAGAISGVCEAMVYAKAVGLDAAQMVDSIGTGAAGSAQLKTMALRILAGDFDPGFFIRHFIKDMKLASEEAEDAGVHLGVLPRYRKFSGQNRFLFIRSFRFRDNTGTAPSQ